MAEKLYPSLEEFYRDHNNLDTGQEDIWYSVEDNKLYRTQKRAKNCKALTGDMFRQPGLADHEYQGGCTPSAPPLEEISWDDLGGIECFPDYTLLRDQTLLPPYAHLDPLCTDYDTAWVDDLQPDYDSDSSNRTEPDYHDTRKQSAACINNLPTTAIKDQPEVANPTARRPTVTGSQEHRNEGRPSQLPSIGVQGRHHKQAKVKPRVKAREEEDHVVTAECAGGGGPYTDYTAWVRWRKQVNRQLAALILLGQGQQVRLQTVDLSRKPLSQTSVQEVLQRAANGCAPGVMTSLNGKPYIMYGIPRVALGKTHVMG